MNVRRTVLAALLPTGLSGWAAALAAPEPIVIGQSVPSGIGTLNWTVALKQGARALVGSVNANGGIQGRQVRLVALEANDAAGHASNVERLVKEHQAVAVIACAGDAACAAMARVAAELRVPLVGALSGAPEMSQRVNPWVFTIRPGYRAEALALAQQVQTLSVTRSVLLTDSLGPSSKVQALRAAFEARKIDLRVVDLVVGNEAAAVEQVARVDAQLLVADLLPETLDALARHEDTIRARWPRFVVSLASGALQGLGNLLPDRALGYSQVVPNPDTDGTAVAAEFQQAAEQHSAGRALTFDGMAAYLAAKLAVHGIRRALPHADGPGVAAALAATQGLDLGGYRVGFAGGRETGSDWVGIGLRSRQGRYSK